MNVPSAAELAVLNDLGSRLTSIHDPDEVLRRVAVEARRLLGVDVAYLMLECDGMLRIEVAEGTLGTALEGVEIPPGAGLGGRVMETGEPMWSPDYLNDSALRHLRGVDAAAASERLGGIVGVPLRVAGNAIGVLFAASRMPRSFADREVVLLSALAAHAAVALHNARLLEGYQRATEALSRSVALHERLVRVVTAGGGPGAVVAALGEELGTRVVFAGEGVPVLVGEERVGALAAGGEVPVHLLETGATVVALAVAAERAVGEAERRARGELLAALFSGRLDEATVRRRARLAGVDLDHTGCVAVVSPAMPELAERLCRDGHGWTAEHDGQSVVLLHTGDPVAVRERMGGLAGTAAVARSAGGAAGVRQAYEEAAGCVAVLRGLGREGRCALPDELGVYRALLRRANEGELARFVTATLGPLLEHRRAGDLTATAEAYLARFRHHADTCAALHIHPNTLYKRLKRIAELLGEDWDGPERALDTHLALRLHRLR